jgi:hypothetical protein
MLVDIITVVFDEEVYLLEWQAKSINKFLDPKEVNEIIVVDNGSQNCAPPLEWYGRFADKVKILTHKHLDLKVMPHLDGWRTQQICKILSAAQSRCEYSMILDAKTFFAKDIHLHDFFYDRRPAVGTVPVSAHWNDARKYLEDYFNVEINDVIGPGGVPFFFHNETIRQMIDTIDDFNTWFQQNLYEQYPPHRLLVTEFMLYCAFVLQRYGKYDSLYAERKTLRPFNVADWEPEKFEKLFTTDSDTISIAEKTKSLLDQGQLSRWEAFLNEKYN